MYNIKLNEEQFKNLIVFLGRTNLNGTEVQPFNSIMISITSSKKEVEKELEEKKNDTKNTRMGNTNK